MERKWKRIIILCPEFLRQDRQQDTMRLVFLVINVRNQAVMVMMVVVVVVLMLMRMVMKMMVMVYFFFKECESINQEVFTCHH